MLIHRAVEATSWSNARVAATAILSVATAMPAWAGTVTNLNCVGGAWSYNCVSQGANVDDPYLRIVPDALGEADEARASARDHRWLARCRPVLEHDIYGVARYRYAAPDCEFGAGAE